MSQFATASELRDFMEWTGSTGRKSATNLDLLLGAASDFLEKRTGRIITASASNTTRKFTTNGRAYVVIPDLRSASTVTLQGADLQLDASYWLLPSRQSPEVFVGLQLRAFGQGSYLANPEWFDRDLDQLWGRYGPDTSLPNDLVVTGLWGWDTPPPEWKMATMALAAYYYQHADALFTGARATPEGFLLNLTAVPTEVQALIDGWSLGEEAILA